MFGFSKKKPPTPATEGINELNLGTEDRDVIKASKSSDELAKELLEQAQEKAKDKSSGEEVTVELTEAHRDVHHLELFLSLMTLAPRYCLNASLQQDNEQTFIKI
ncbi:MAG: hypothetical protein NVSMB39_2910 [Candidatus Saccharimonadales bacterium]